MAAVAVEVRVRARGNLVVQALVPVAMREAMQVAMQGVEAVEIIRSQTKPFAIPTIKSICLVVFAT